jgi:error-prone DNA polymerase
VGDRDFGFLLPHGRGDEFYHGSAGIDPRSLPPKGPKPRDIYVPNLHIDSIKVKTRDFRQLSSVQVADRTMPRAIGRAIAPT